MWDKNCVTALFLAAVCTHDATLKHKGHSAYFNTAVTKQDFMKILGVSSQK